MNRFLTFILCALISSGIAAQGFEGTIEFKKVRGSKESSYIYYIKGDKVRLEEFGSHKKIVDLLVIDLNTELVYMLSPERKTYMVLNTKESHKDMSKTRVNITTDTRTIHGYACKKWVVTNEELNAEVTYWVTKGHFDFFTNLLATLQRKDYHSLFYRQVPEAVGYFPMVSIYYDLDGNEIDRLEVTNVKKMQLPPKTFEIPSNYTEFKTN